MSEYITVEPAPELAGPFAVWCLSRDANVQTVSAGGFLVPLDWYAEVPSELLSGAHVDGFAYDRSMPQPVSEKPAEAPPEAWTEPLAPSTPEAVVPLTAETLAAKKPVPRKRASRTRKAAGG